MGYILEYPLIFMIFKLTCLVSPGGMSSYTMIVLVLDKPIGIWIFFNLKELPTAAFDSTFSYNLLFCVPTKSMPCK